MCDLWCQWACVTHRDLPEWRCSDLCPIEGQVRKHSRCFVCQWFNLSCQTWAPTWFLMDIDVIQAQHEGFLLLSVSRTKGQRQNRKDKKIIHCNKWLAENRFMNIYAAFLLQKTPQIDSLQCVKIRAVSFCWMFLLFPPLKPLHNPSRIPSVALVSSFFHAQRNTMRARERARVYFLKCPLIKVLECMTGCKREMEWENEDAKRNGGEVNYKLVDSPGGSPSLCSHVWS